MDIGIGLPATIPGVERDSVLEWSRRSDQAGFSSLGTIGRTVYPNWEELISLAAAAAVTERIRLVTSILLAPLRNAAMLAKQAATLDTLSNGRLVLGLAVGAREDDYATAGVDLHRRGQIFERQLEEMTSIWSGEPKGVAGAVGPPSPSGRPGLLIGGTADVAFERAARFGDGYIAGGGGPDPFAEGAAKMDAAWQRAGREGTPAKKGLTYFALGSSAEEDARRYLGDYYGWLGDEIAGMIIGSAATTPEAVKQQISAFEEKGCDELILFPCADDPTQVELLAEAAL
ncbi:MAG: LLM class flavin-dependent oxidoreductase [Thermoleophilaceae bacterium]